MEIRRSSPYRLNLLQPMRSAPKRRRHANRDSLPHPMSPSVISMTGTSNITPVLFTRISKWPNMLAVTSATRDAIPLPMLRLPPVISALFHRGRSLQQVSVFALAEFKSSIISHIGIRGKSRGFKMT